MIIAFYELRENTKILNRMRKLMEPSIKEIKAPTQNNRTLLDEGLTCKMHAFKGLALVSDNSGKNKNG